MRKYDFELTLEEIRANQKAHGRDQIKVGQLLPNESGFSLTQESLSSTHRTAGCFEYDNQNKKTDLFEH